MTSIPTTPQLRALLKRQGLDRPQRGQDALKIPLAPQGPAKKENAPTTGPAKPTGATPMEMAFAAIDQSKIHRRSVEMDAPACRIDRNLTCRIIVRALTMERESYKHRAKYQRRGALGDLSIALLMLLLNFGRKYGKIFPDYDTLAALLRKDKEAVIEAMKRLITQKFVTKHRRSKMITTPQGQRRVQDSNAYEVHMPEEGLAVLPLIVGKASGSEEPDVSGSRAHIDNRSLPEKDRWWLAEPWRMADGSVY